MKNTQKMEKTRLRSGVAWFKPQLLIILIFILAISGFILLRHNPSDPQAAFFKDVLNVAPAFYSEQLKILGATPVESDSRAGCIESYQGYPPGEKSPSSKYPYVCLIHISRTYTAPADRSEGSAAVKAFAETAKLEGFVSKDGVTQDDGTAIYWGNRYYKGKQECLVQISYSPAVPANPGSNDAIEANYEYELNCGGETYPYIPPGFLVGTHPQAGY